MIPNMMIISYILRYLKSHNFILDTRILKFELPDEKIISHMS